MDIREEQVTSECGTLRLRRQGQGAPLLFLHGSQGMNGWPDYLERLAQHHEVIAPDLPGFGRSDTSQRVGTVSDTTRVLLDLIDTLGLAAPGSLHLAGHCIGGWAAMELAVRSTAIASLIKARTQVIWGADNRVLPPAYGSGLAAMLKATLTSIPKAGHFAQIEQAQICAEATLGFTGR